MSINAKLRLVAAVLMAVTVLAIPGFARKTEDRVVSAKGNGTMKVGKEEFKISAVVVKLLENGKVEINLISEISVFVSGNWTRSDVSSNEVNLTITEAAAGGFNGTGKLFFAEGQKSIVRLSMQGSSKVSERKINVDFVADPGN